VKSKVPALVGVPAIVPLVPDNDKPAGKEPDRSFQVSSPPDRLALVPAPNAPIPGNAPALPTVSAPRVCDHWIDAGGGEPSPKPGEFSPPSDGRRRRLLVTTRLQPAN
jgi:hypothetical protein